MKTTIEQLLQNIDKYKAGTKIELSGTIYTARDQAHKRLVELLNGKKELPIDLKNACIYYCGPCPNAPGKIIGSCGPTTSSRMDVYTPTMLSNGVKILIGKGKRSFDVFNSIQDNKAIYLLATGGVGALIAEKVKSFKLVAFEDLGPEAIYEIKIKDFPLIVGIDCLGNSLFNDSSKNEIYNFDNLETNNVCYIQEDIELKILDWTDKFEKVPTLQEVRDYVKELIEKAEPFTTLSSDWKIDIRGNREKRKHIIHSSRRKYMSKEEVNRHHKYIKGLEELINNSKYESSKINTKQEEKPDIEKYHYFESKIKIGKNEYKIILHTEQYKGEKEDKPQTVHLYDVLEVNKKQVEHNSLATEIPVPPATLV